MILTSRKSSHSRCCCLDIGLHSRKRAPAYLALVLQGRKLILLDVQYPQASADPGSVKSDLKKAGLRLNPTYRSSHDQGSGSVLFVLGAYRADGLCSSRR